MENLFVLFCKKVFHHSRRKQENNTCYEKSRMNLDDHFTLCIEVRTISLYGEEFKTILTIELYLFLALLTR